LTCNDGFAETSSTPDQKGTFGLSHGWDRGVAVFDDVNLVSCAGLVPVLELAEQTGLSELLDEHPTSPASW